MITRITQFYLPINHAPYLPLLLATEHHHSFVDSHCTLRRDGQAELTWVVFTLLLLGVKKGVLRRQLEGWLSGWQDSVDNCVCWLLALTMSASQWSYDDWLDKDWSRTAPNWAKAPAARRFEVCRSLYFTALQSSDNCHDVVCPSYFCRVETSAIKCLKLMPTGSLQHRHGQNKIVLSCLILVVGVNRISDKPRLFSVVFNILETEQFCPVLSAV